MFTARQILNDALIETNKVHAPSLLLDEYNYLINKAINLYLNKRYSIYDVNQLSTDDIRVIKSTAILNPTKVTAYGQTSGSLYNATYEVTLPSDYLHLLNCVCFYKLNGLSGCLNTDDIVPYAAKRLTSDSWSTLLNDYYNRPSPERPYFYIHHVNSNNKELTNPYNTELTNPYNIGTKKGTDIYDEGRFSLEIFINKGEDNRFINIKNDEGGGIYEGTEYYIKKDWIIKTVEGNSITIGEFIGSNGEVFRTADPYILVTPDASASAPDIYCIINYNLLFELTSLTDPKIVDKALSLDTLITLYPRTLDLSFGKTTKPVSLIEKNAGLRHSNTTEVRMEIRYGRDDSIFKLVLVHVDYIKSPLFIRITQTLMDLTEDTSLVMEFPDNVCHEIVNELVTLILEHAGDTRLQSHYSVTLSIALPASQLTTTKS